MWSQAKCTEVGEYVAGCVRVRVHAVWVELVTRGFGTAYNNHRACSIGPLASCCEQRRPVVCDCQLLRRVRTPKCHQKGG